jgi:hypothetical protein
MTYLHALGLAVIAVALMLIGAAIYHHFAVYLPARRARNASTAPEVDDYLWPTATWWEGLL